jgi:hypothetical protein
VEILADVLINGVGRPNRIIVVTSGNDQIYIPGVDQRGDCGKILAGAPVIPYHCETQLGCWDGCGSWKGGCG